MAELPAPPAPTIISAEQARRLGLHRYFTGVPCKHGHLAERTIARSQCMACKSVSDRARYAADPEPAKARAKARHSACAEAIRSYNRSRYLADPDAVAARRDKWRADNPERMREKGRQYAANRKARLLGAEGSYTAEDVARIFAAQKGKCAYCRRRLNQYDVDHIIALAAGGSNHPRNLQILCPPCNRSKHTKHPIAFAQAMGMLI